MKGFIISLIVAFVASAAHSAPQTPKEYPLRLQPELDSVDVDSYLKNDRLFNFQLKCLLDEGPCDILGKFLKPRVAKALLGNCPVCTPIQKIKIERVLEELQTNRPVVYRSLFVKFIENAGIKVDDDKKEAPVPVTEKESETQKEEEKVEPAVISNDSPTEAVTTVLPDISA